MSIDVQYIDDTKIESAVNKYAFGILAIAFNLQELIKNAKLE